MRRFQLHQREHGVGESTVNGSVSALRFLFAVTLKRPDLSRRLVLARRPRKVPDVLSVEEVAKLLEAAPGIKYRAAPGIAYGAGLRVSEVAHLKVDDIDSKRMLIRIEEGKRRKDRNAMLSPQLLDLLRLWWREGKRRSVLLPHGWLYLRARGEAAPDELLAHVAPLGWRHISLTGDYLWQNAAADLDREGYRPLNFGDEPAAKLA